MTDVDDEVRAMQTILVALSPFSQEAKNRILTYVIDRHRTERVKPAPRDCGVPGCTFGNEKCDRHKEEYARARANGMPASGRFA